MRDCVFIVGRHFSERQSALVGDEDGVVAETGCAVAPVGDPALYAALKEEWLAVILQKGDDGAEARLPPRASTKRPVSSAKQSKP